MDCNGTDGGMKHMRDNANEYPSNDMLASKFRANEPNALNYMNQAINHANDAWGKRESARVESENAAAEKNTAQSNKDSAQSYLKAINDSANAVQTYANAHDYGYLTEQIDEIEKAIVKVEKKRDDVDEPPYERDSGIKANYDASMVAYMKELDEQSKQNPFDAAAIILKQLEADLGVCTAAVSEIDAKIAQEKVKYGNLENKILEKQPYIDSAKNRRDQRYADLIAEKKKYEDLSGELLGLQIEKDELSRSITEKERYYGELLKQQKKLNAAIIYWNQKIYSNKVYNSQNLLKLSENIDHNLQYIFSHLKTQNVNPELLHTKIQYRKTEEQKLTNADKVLDVIFYCFYFSFVVIMIVTRNINAEHFVYYIFIGLIPFLFPFIFKNVNYLIHSFQLDHQKNAFIESDELDNENMVHAYNI